MSAALILAAAAVVSAGAQTQAPAKKPAVKGAAPAQIAWVAAYDLAIKRMGADQTPVILYFTYDG